MVEWFRATGFSKSGGPWFKSSTLSLSGICSRYSRVQLLNRVAQMADYLSASHQLGGGLYQFRLYLQYLFMYLQCPQLTE